MKRYIPLCLAMKKTGPNYILPHSFGKIMRKATKSFKVLHIVIQGTGIHTSETQKLYFN